MKKIVLPTDFSDNALNAINYALQLFKDDVCTFYLLNTYTPMIYTYEYQINADQHMMEAVDMVKKNSKTKLDELLRSLKKKYNNPKHKYATISSFSILSDEVVEFADKHNIDLVVMGTKGASKAREVLFGSNTIHVIKKAKCPVLAIPENFSFEAPKEILFPTDYKIDFKLTNLKLLIELANMYNPRINILHTFKDGELSEDQEKNKLVLDNYFSNTAHLFHNVTNQKLPDAIEKFQIRAKINLLVMINTRHSFFEKLFSKSAIHEIALHLNIPLLVVPAK
jgi:nucleotide-binding universal stress UspA family protein